MMDESYYQDKGNDEKLQKRVKWYKAQLLQPKIFLVTIFINKDTCVGEKPLPNLTTSTTPSTDLRL